MITISAPNPIRKLYLAIATIGVLSVSQGVWACEKPQVSGYDIVDCLSEGLAVVKKNGKWGFVDKTGQVVVPLQYDNAWGFRGGLSVVVSNDKRGFIDKTGKVVVPLQYDSVKKDFSDGRMFAEVKRNGHTYYVSKLGDEYTDFGPVSEGLVWVKKDGKYGFIDTTGKVVIALQYDDVWSFSEGLAGVQKNGKWGFIDKTGKMVIAPQYDHFSHFKNGQAKVGLNDGKTPEYFYIDKTGKVLTKRTSLAEFRKKLAQGDDVFYKTSNDSGKGMIFEIKGNLVQVQTTESQCTQRDYKGNCQNYVKNPVAKWVKRSEIYPVNHFD